MKIGLLARVLLNDPSEFGARLLTALEYQIDRARRPVTLRSADRFIAGLSSAAGLAIEGFLEEDGLKEIHRHVIGTYTGSAESFHNATIPLASLCYAVCRAKQPHVVLETGVGNGVTTAFILQALALNGAGELWSIDLPPLGSSGSGGLVPHNLKARWHLANGRTRERLPYLVKELVSVDVFVHDSLHTYRNMLFEFGTVWPHMKRGGIIVSDDIAMNRAFEVFFQSKGTFFARRDNFGAAVAT